MQLKDLPGPPGLLGLGNALSLRPDRLHLQIENWCNSHGPRFVFRMLRRPVLVMGDADDIQTVLRQRPDGFGRYQAIAPVLEEMGIRGLFSAEGDDWRRHRKLWMAATNIHQVAGFQADLTQLGRHLANRLDQLAGAARVVDVRREFTRFTVDVTTRFAFGQSSDTLRRGTTEIQHRLDRVMPALNRRIAAPWPYWRLCPLPADRLLARDLRALESTVKGFIASARQRQSGVPDCLLDALIQQQVDGQGLSDDALYGSTLMTLIAGEDTTANAMAWLVDCLGRQPALQSEYADVLAEPGHHTAALDALIMETLRLRPVAPLIFLSTRQDLRLNGLSLPAGTDVILATRHAMRRSGQFEQADVFRPERWTPERLTRANTLPPMPFGGGPRMCPGRNLAMAEIRMVARLLLSRFRIELVDAPPETPEVLKFAMAPGDLRVRLHPR